MAISFWKPALVSASPVIGRMDRYVRKSSMLYARVHPSEGLSHTNSQENEDLHQVLDSGHFSRRKSMLCLSAATLGCLNLLSLESAEAGTARLENRRKALEKLREKAGESRARTRTETKKNGRGQSPPSPKEQAIGPLIEAKLS